MFCKQPELPLKTKYVLILFFPLDFINNQYHKNATISQALNDFLKEATSFPSPFSKWEGFDFSGCQNCSIKIKLIFLENSYLLAGECRLFV